MARILILDDDSGTRTFLRHILERLMRHEVAEASTVQEALEKVRDSRFDLMFLDQNLPDGTAVDFCEGLAGIGSHRQTPKWVVTGEKPLKETSDRWSRLKIDGYLIKPVSVDHILDAVHQCLDNPPR